MGNAALAWNNLIDLSTTLIAATNELPLVRATDFLRKGANEHVLWRWFSSGSSTSILIDFGSSVSIDTIAIMALTGVNPTTRFRFSLTDPTGVAGEAFDSTAAAGRHSAAYMMCPYLRTSPSTGRYLLIDISEAGVSSIGAGRLFAGTRDVFTYNFAPGWGMTPVNRSRKEEGAEGQTFVDRKNGYRQADLTFEWINEADRDGFVESIDKIHNLTDGHLDMLWIKDVTSTNPKDFIWGYQDGDRPVTQPFTINDLYAATYKIRQRL